MIEPEQIKKKAERKYANFLRATAGGAPFFPIDFPIGATPRSYPDLQKAVTALIEGSKEKVGFGYRLDLTTKNTHKHSHQSLPTRIYIDSETDYLKLLEKENDFTAFKSDAALIQSTLPALTAWVQRYPLKVVAYHGDWPDLLKVCQYFQHNPQPNLYIRELPIAVHTKFIEEHKDILRRLLTEILSAEQQMPVTGKHHTFEQQFSLKYREPLLSLRILDRALQKKYGFPIADFSLSVSDFSRLQLGSPRCFITENVMPFLTLPLMGNSIAIWGSGWAVSLLKSAVWLRECPIFYWGDMDVEGFKILAEVRSHFPQTQSILMNASTYEAFAAFSVPNETKPISTPEPLTADEQALYTHLSTTQKRLEQERINQAFVNQFLASIDC